MAYIPKKPTPIRKPAPVKPRPKNPVSKPPKGKAPPKKPVGALPPGVKPGSSSRGINSFVSSFKQELARPSRYDVLIPIPAILAPAYLTTAKNLNLRCESTTLPGRSFATTERKFGSSPIQKIPYQPVYTDVSMTFIVGGDMKERLLFDQWMEIINPSSTYNFNYRADYVTDIGIIQYDLQNNVTYNAVLIDAYPLEVNQLDLDWSNDGYHKLSVVFAYTKWQEGTLKSNLGNLGTQALGGFLSGGLGNF